ncbi:MAG: N2,N2-dimethylguanosine tRNA methyltransferase [Cyanobacteriota bacterium]|nr:N2,N2-dimethylguanosine tRNA methyltransferase [Cyanobacteriota bacterium]
MRLGPGFFRADSRPSRDLGVLIARQLAMAGPLRVLDAMTGCGIRSLRYGLEAGAERVWANDADPDRRALIHDNLIPLGDRAHCSSLTAQQLLVGCLQREQRFELVDLDAFGCPTALLPLAIAAVSFDGVLYAACSDGRTPTGHERRQAIRTLGASARAHPAGWELALRLLLGAQARAAWAMGRGLEPLLAFSDGRTFRTAVRITRRPAAGAEEQLGLLAHCHGCGEQQVQSLLRLGRWSSCCPTSPDASPLSVSGPLWIGGLQEPSWLEAIDSDPQKALLAHPTTLGLLARLQADPAHVARCWPMAEIGRRLGGGGTPRLRSLASRLRQQGWGAWSSGVMPGCLRTDAPWPVLLALSARVRPDRD